MPSDKLIPVQTRRITSTRTVVFGLEILFVVALLTVWLTSTTIRQERNLWILFFYSFPSEFLISFLPHEPVILYFSKDHSAMTVALVSIAGTMLAEALDYSAIKFIREIKFMEKARKNKAAEKLVNFFWKAPFPALWVAAFLPTPFYPFRFLVVLANYPLWKYLMAILTGRLPKFYLLAFLGKALKIPDLWIAIFFIALILAAYLPVAKFCKNNTCRKS